MYLRQYFYYLQNKKIVLIMPSRSGNIFEANRYCYYFGKLINFNFITISSKDSMNFLIYTSRLDICRFIFAILFILYVAYDNLENDLVITDRSMIFDIGVYFNGEFEILQLIIIFVQFYYFRFEYFEILGNIHGIDKKVRNILFKVLNFLII